MRGACMKKPKKLKLLTGAVALLTAASIFAGCGGGTSSTVSGGTGSIAAGVDAVAGAKKSYTISICGINLEDGVNVSTQQPSEGYNTLAKKLLKEKFPDLDITFIAVPWDNASGKVQTILMSNSTDLFTQGGAFIPEYYKEGLIQSLNPFLEKDNDFVYEDNYPANFKGNANCLDYSGNELLTLPWQVGYRLIIYDKQIFDEWGVEYLSENPTPEEILEKAEKLTGINPVSGLQNYGVWIAGNSLNMSYLIPVTEYYGTPEVTGNYDDPKNLKWALNDSNGFVKAMQWAVDIARFVPPAAATGQGYENFGKDNNDVAIQIDNNGAVIMGEFYKDGDESRIARFTPTMHMGTGGGNWTPVDGMGMASYISGADADQAWEILKYMCGAEVMEWQFVNHGPMAIPHKVSETVFHEKDIYLRKNAEIIAHATHPGYEINPFYGSTLQPTYASMISRSIAGKTVDVQKELDALQAKAEAWSASK